MNIKDECIPILVSRTHNYVIRLVANERIIEYMVKNPKVTSWQRYAVSIIERYLDIRKGEVDDEFKEHIDYLREHIEELDTEGYPANHYPSMLNQFMRYFKFPVEIKGVMRHYIKTDIIDLRLVRPSIAAIDDRDNTYKLNIDDVDQYEYWDDYASQKSFKLVIPNGTTTSEIIEFVRAEKEFIDEKLQNNRMPPRRTKTSPPWLSIRVVNLHRKGFSSDDIANAARHENWEGIALGPNDITKIISRAKAKQRP